MSRRSGQALSVLRRDCGLTISLVVYYVIHTVEKVRVILNPIIYTRNRPNQDALVQY